MKYLVFLPLLIGAAHAATTSTIVQSKNMTFTASYSGTGNNSVSMSDTFTMMVNPFDPTLGTLESFTIAWAPGSMSFSAYSNPGGSASAGGELRGTAISLNGIDYSGLTGSAFGNPNPGGGISATASLGNFSHSYVAASAGSSYDRRLLQAVTGADPVALSVGGNFNYSYRNIINGSVTMTVPVTVTYTYTPIPEPSAALLGGLGALALLRRRGR